MARLAHRVCSARIVIILYIYSAGEACRARRKVLYASQIHFQRVLTPFNAQAYYRELNFDALLSHSPVGAILVTLA